MEDFIDEKELLKPQDLLNQSGDLYTLPEKLILSFKHRVPSIAVEKFGAKLIGQQEGAVVYKHYGLNYKGVEIGVMTSDVGAPCVVGLMEEAAVLGVKDFILFGSCGLIDDSAKGKLIVPTSAYRGEGTSSYYAPKSDYITVTTAPKTASVLKDLGLPVVTGKVWTTDAIYRETPTAVKRRKAEGCLAVEMECSAIAAVSQYRKFNAYQFLIGEDDLTGDNWQGNMICKTTPDYDERYLTVALELAIRV